MLSYRMADAFLALLPTAEVVWGDLDLVHWSIFSQPKSTHSAETVIIKQGRYSNFKNISIINDIIDLIEIVLWVCFCFQFKRLCIISATRNRAKSCHFTDVSSWFSLFFTKQQGIFCSFSGEIVRIIPTANPPPSGELLLWSLLYFIPPPAHHINLIHSGNHTMNYI